MNRILDLFCGMGGFSLGFLLTIKNINITGFDKNPKAVETYNHNLSHLGGEAKQTDLLDTMPTGKYDVIIGGSPCQPFSFANTYAIGEKHPLYPTFPRFFDIVLELQPRLFIFENVKGLLRPRFSGLLFTQLGKLAANYKISWKVLDAAWYGVPQHRERLFIVGVRKDLGVSWHFPEPTHAPSKIQRFDGSIIPAYVTVFEAIGDIMHEAEIKPQKPHFSRLRHILRLDKPAYCIRTTSSRETLLPLDTDYQRKHPPLKLHEVSRTITSHLSKTSRDLLLPATTLLKDGYLRLHGHHECLSHVYRRATVRECLRLQSFPDWWDFLPTVSKTQQYKLIGEAVPPLLAYHLAMVLKKKIF